MAAQFNSWRCPIYLLLPVPLALVGALDFVVERIALMPLKEALIEAARLRFRPIIMTTLTVLVISGPLVFGRGQGTEFGQRLGVMMFGGIISSAVLTFFVVPAAFHLFERGRSTFKAATVKTAPGIVDEGKEVGVVRSTSRRMETVRPKQEFQVTQNSRITRSPPLSQT